MKIFFKKGNLKDRKPNNTSSITLMEPLIKNFPIQSPNETNKSIKPNQIDQKSKFNI